MPTAVGLELFVSPDGDDAAPGTAAQPLATLIAAQIGARRAVRRGAGPITVTVRAGTYYLKEPLTFGPDDASPDSPVIYTAAPGEVVTLSGGTPLTCRWRPYRDGIWQCDVPEVADGRLSFT